MSDRLVENRRQRIASMENFAIQQTQDALKRGEEWVQKSKFLDFFCVNTGVRERLGLQYFTMLLNIERFEQDTTQTLFRHRITYQKAKTELDVKFGGKPDKPKKRGEKEK